MCFLHRATDKAHSILKECSDSLGQAVRGLPPSDPAARTAVSTDESMDTTPSTMKVCSLILMLGVLHSGLSRFQVHRLELRLEEVQYLLLSILKIWNCVA